MTFLFSAAIILAFLLWTARRNPKPPVAQTESELLSAGFTLRQAKIEARQQRAEHRSHARTQNDAAKAGARVARAIIRSIR